MSLTQLIGLVTAIWVVIWIGTAMLLFHVRGKRLEQLVHRIEILEER